jgi:predicted RNA-binding Zn-ribbon protein involved in translation (DUF1610 family)
LHKTLPHFPATTRFVAASHTNPPAWQQVSGRVDTPGIAFAREETTNTMRASSGFDLQRVDRENVTFLTVSGCMKSHLEHFMRVQELTLLSKSLELFGGVSTCPGKKLLAEEITRARRRVPGCLLSQFDAASRRHLEPLASVSDYVCHGCGGELSGRLLAQLRQPGQWETCPHCGRLLYSEECSPEFVGTK